MSVLKHEKIVHDDTHLLCTILRISFPKIYELATGHWLFKPEATDGLSYDVVHLAQMTQCTGQNHDDIGLKQYKTQEKQHNLQGMEIHHRIFWFIHLLYFQACWNT